MNKKKRIFWLIAGALILAIGIFCLARSGVFSGGRQSLTESEAIFIEPDSKTIVEISANATFSGLMAQTGLDPVLVNEIYQAALETYDLAKIKAGRFLELTFSKDNGEFKELVYKIDSEEELVVRCASAAGSDAVSDVASPDAPGVAVFTDVEAIDSAVPTVPAVASVAAYEAFIRPIAYEVRIATKEGEIKTSMYEAALENDIDERAIIALADAFQWSIDFAMDPRVDDTFKLIYEERYLDGEYQMPGKILAGQYINDGKKYQVYYFEEDEDNSGYFDEEGNSVQKMFLKAPVAFKYISSGFTTGLRYVEAFNVSTGHRAIDYAAPIGTPIRAVGDGTIISAGWNGSYGYMIKLRHNGTYQTNYAHLSKFAVKSGAKVKQGDVIGYVGSTGFSTGPHLHYEMVKNGVKINPLTEVLPPGKAIREENRVRFFEEIASWQAVLEE
ncbi:MAG: peptidoglycan DD-metalloendopeptidase family protein [Patescibacteria group bacterium]